MKRNQTCFEVTVTPPCKKKAPLEPSPILILGRFKGSPSLSFKDVKVGSSACKGFWVENPNDCTVKVIVAKLPPAKRGLSFSESEFVLESGCSCRIEVTWSPTCEGSWRDIVQIQVWGLPPPHLNFRLILHLTSVLPKIKQKCCQMAPLRSRNIASSKVQATSSKVNVRSGCCHSPRTAKGNMTKKKPVLSKERRLQSVMDSLENAPPRVKDFICIDDDGLPPCDVPSTPIRRNTYCITDVSSNPLLTDTFTMEEELPSSEVKCEHRLLKALEEPWSPIDFNENIYKDNGNNPHWTPTRSIAGMNIHGPEQCSTKSKKRNFDLSTGTNSAKHLFPIMGEETKSIDSSPWQNPAAKCLLTPQCSPLHTASPEYRAENADNIKAGYHARDQRCAEMTAYVDINQTFINDFSKTINQDMTRKQTNKDKIEMCVSIHNACFIIQRNWRFHKARKDRAKILQDMNKAASVIQRSWRFHLARKHAREDRAKILKDMNKAASVIQRSWRFHLARKHAREDRAKILKDMNKAASVIQRSWRFHLARKHAREDRAKILKDMNKAASVIQRSWRFHLARKHAREDRAKILKDMNKAASVIQRSWRFHLARKHAREDRAKILKDMNKAASVIQRSWRFHLARKHAREDRAKILKDMNKAASVIQRSWRFHLARKHAREDRAKILKDMNKAASVIQRSWRFHLARKHAREDRAGVLQHMNLACSVIQRSWRVYFARKMGARERADKWMLMHNASCVIQRSWRNYIAKKKAARERAEILASIERKYKCPDDRNLTEDNIKPDKCLFEILEKFHLKPRAYELLFELADLHSLDNLHPAFKLIQNSILRGELTSKQPILHCDVATQTVNAFLDGGFERPVTSSLKKAPQAKLISSSRVSARRSLVDSLARKNLLTAGVGVGKREVPEKERWNSVAEAVGRLNLTPQK